MRKLWMVALLLAAGCTTTVAGSGGKLTGRPAKVFQPMLGCTEASRAARVTVQRLGYTLAEVKNARPGEPGFISGAKEQGWSGYDPNPRGKQTIEVSVECSDAGSEISAISSEGGLAQLSFARQFKSALEGEVGNKRERPRLESERARGLILKLEPQRSDESVAALGVDLPAAGITPVRVEVDNQSDRRYSLAADSFVLYTVAGQREAPLAVVRVAERLSSTDSPPESVLREKSLQAGEVGPGERAVGYLYFEASTYRRARVNLIDVESGEPEGFSLRF